MGAIFTLNSNEANAVGNSAFKILNKKGKNANICVFSHLDMMMYFQAMQNNVRLFTATVAYLKAKQAAITGRSTKDIFEEFKNPESGLTASILGIDKDSIISWDGGYPIYDKDGILLGGIGVSNLIHEEDGDVVKEAIVQNDFLWKKPK